MWAALARASTEGLQQRQFTPLPNREALSILQARAHVVACPACAACSCGVAMFAPGSAIALQWVHSTAKCWQRVPLPPVQFWGLRQPGTHAYAYGMPVLTWQVIRLICSPQGRKLGVARLRLLPKRTGTLWRSPFAPCLEAMRRSPWQCLFTGSQEFAGAHFYSLYTFTLQGMNSLAHLFSCFD